MKRNRRGSRIEKADGDSKTELFRLSEIEPEFVSLVTAGANRQKEFMVVKADTEKEVPASDADAETKRQAQSDRAAKYGIEARADGNLSFPSEDPTKETMYGDPVNLMYPFGGSANTVDPDRVRNALVRFSQARDQYSEKTSKVHVLQRIVEAALSAGVEVGWPEDDDIYNALPADLKERIKEKATKDTDGEATAGGTPEKDAVDLASWLNEAGNRVDEMILDQAVQAALDTPADPPTTDKGNAEAQKIDDRGTPPDKVHKEVEDEKAVLEQKLKKALQENAALMAKNARLGNEIGKTSVMLTGEVTTKGLQTNNNEKTSPSRGAFLSGGDIAAVVVQSAD